VSLRRKRRGTVGRHRVRHVRTEAPKRSFEPSDFGLPNDSAGPVKSALVSAFTKNFGVIAATVEDANAIVRQSAATTDTAGVVQRIKDLIPVAQTLKELSDWVSPPRRPMEFGEAVRNAQALAAASPDSDEVELWFQALRTRSVGAPARRRESFIGAFEFMLQSKGNSQGLATRKFCGCGKEKHDANCERNLKAGVRSLKSVLRKHAPQLLARYDSLHPDRAKKADG
jgi:hypothetical protein